MIMSWQRRDPLPDVQPAVEEHPRPDADRSYGWRQSWPTPPAAQPPLDRATLDDLVRALETLQVYEDRLAAYEQRPSNVDCPRACCSPTGGRP